MSHHTSKASCTWKLCFLARPPLLASCLLCGLLPCLVLLSPCLLSACLCLLRLLALVCLLSWGQAPSTVCSTWQEFAPRLILKSPPSPHWGPQELATNQYLSPPSCR